MFPALSQAKASDSRRGQNFLRACYALAQSRAFEADATEFVPKDDTVVRLIIERATTMPGSTTGSGWADTLVSTSLRGFLSSLEQYSAGARLIAQAVPATFNGVGVANYPVRVGRVTPAWVNEMDAIPVVSSEFANVVIGPARKMSHIVVWSRELGKRSDARSVFAQMLREDVGAGIDAGFFSDTAGTTAAPAGLLYGVDALTASSVSGALAATEDLALLAETVSTGGSGSVLYVMAPQRLARLRVIAPEVVRTNDIAASAVIPPARVIAVDPRSILVGVDPAPDISASQHAAIHMSDEPLEIGSDSHVTAAPVRSLWQTGSTAFRVIYELDFVPRRTGAVAFVDNAYWA